MLVTLRFLSKSLCLIIVAGQVPAEAFGLVARLAAHCRATHQADRDVVERGFAEAGEREGDGGGAANAAVTTAEANVVEAEAGKLQHGQAVEVSSTP
jgi:hypothetical protein